MDERTAPKRMDGLVVYLKNRIELLAKDTQPQPDRWRCFPFCTESQLIHIFFCDRYDYSQRCLSDVKDAISSLVVDRRLRTCTITITS